MSKKRDFTRKMIDLLNSASGVTMTEEQKVAATDVMLEGMEEEGWIWGKTDERLLKRMRSEKGRKSIVNYFRRHK